MLMALGMFVFSLPTLSYQEMQRQTSWRHPSNSRVGSRPARQFVGPGDDGITLSGVLMPELMGRSASLDELREMADTGKAWALASGAGEIFGAFVIESMNTTGTVLMDNGKPRRIEFQLQLARVDDQRTGSRVAAGGLGESNSGGDWYDWNA